MMRRISLVQPSLSLKERYGTLGQLGYIEPHIGLCYLASVVRQNGFDVQVVDAQALSLDLMKTKELILSFQPSFVGITAVSQLITAAAALAEEIKKSNKLIVTIIGGCHITSLPGQTMLDFPNFDIGVLEEGEDTLVELLKALALGRDISLIKGIIFKKDGNLIQTEPRPRIEDLDRLPFPAFDLLPRIEKYYRVGVQSCSCGPTISLNTSRGCSSQCTFCDASIHGRYLRYHSAGYVFKLLKHCIQKYKINNFFFNDSSFLLPFLRFKKLANLIEKERLRIHWSCMSRIDIINEEMLSLAKKIGCQQILYGIESGSQKILDFYKKGITLAQIKKNIALTKKKGILAKGFFIFGNPLESKKTIKESIDFMMDVGLDDVGISLFAPFPGTIHYNNISQYGNYINRWEKMSHYMPVFIPHGFNEKKLLNYTKIAYRKFYFRGPIIVSYLKRCNNFWRIINFLRAGIVFIYYTFFERDI